MKILVIGNGFDLAHYLPTKYSQFIGVLKAIEKLPNDKNKIDFKDLFGELLISEQWFFDQTKELYAVDEIRFDHELILGIKEKLGKNVWYAYFKHHLAEIETWIDFETKIEEALEVFCLVSEIIESHKDKTIVMNKLRFLYNNEDFKVIIKDESILDVLDIFNFIEVKKGETIGLSPIASDKVSSIIFKEDFFKKYKNTFQFSFEKLLTKLNAELEKFTNIFNIYLYGIVNLFEPKKQPELLPIINGLDIVFSFNYTSTFDNFYRKQSSTPTIETLHGRAGKDSKGLVLGINGLQNESLKKNKAYGFTKYHQKLVKDTDYLFLIENSKIQDAVDLAKLHGNQGGDYPFLSIYLWGHSLDVSDRNYIDEIFSFNKSENVSRYVQVTIFYHCEQSRFSMLANLIHILDEKRVELWMKKRWLTFERAPNIF